MSKVVRHGSRTGQRLPISTATSDSPTHHTVQTNVGAMFISGSRVPHSAAAMVSMKSSQASARKNVCKARGSTMLACGCCDAPAAGRDPTQAATKLSATTAQAAPMTRQSGTGSS